MPQLMKSVHLSLLLHKKTKMVEKIVYPKVDPLADKGRTNDLFLKKEILFNPAPKFQVN